MPIINAVNSTWLTGKAWLPNLGNSYAVFNNFSSKQISDRNSTSDLPYGVPYEKIWDVGHTYWQTNFSCPLLVTEQYSSPSMPYFNSIQFIDSFLKEIFRVNGFKQGDAFTDNTLKDKWDFNSNEIITSPNVDYIIKSFSIDITESDSSFSISILSTTDIRDYFNLFTAANSNITPLLPNKVYRLVKPFDVFMPSGCIGAPLGFIHNSSRHWPIQTTEMNQYSSLLREFHLSIETNTTQTATIGMPTSRPFLGTNSIKCTGSIKYIPLFFDNNSITFQKSGSTFSPAGFSVDMQAIDYISNSIRNGGKLYVSISTYPTMYVQAKVRGSNSYIFDGTNTNTPIGPVSISSWGLDTSGGAVNTISADFVTSPGLTSF